jgi:hypothetical protein
VVSAAGGGTIAVDAESLGTPGELGVILQTAHPLISNLTLKQGATTFTNTGSGGDDYTIVDAKRGLIYLVLAADGGDINPAAEIKVGYDYGATIDRDQIDGGTEVVIEASVHFSADNAEGPNRDGFFYRASLTSDGDLGLIQNEFGTWTLKCKLLDDSEGLFGGSTESPLYELTDPPSA